jgi:hypothetical protein
VRYRYGSQDMSKGQHVQVLVSRSRGVPEWIDCRIEDVREDGRFAVRALDGTWLPAPAHEMSIRTVVVDESETQ